MDLKDLLQRRYQSLYAELVGLVDNFPYPLRLDDETANRLRDYLDLLQLWTVKIDLVAPAPPEVLLERHIVDSIASALVFRRHVIDIDPARAYVDLGSGAGLPGLVLAALEPERPIILCEPRQKRAIFLKEAISHLNLPKAVAICERAEKLDITGLPTPQAVWARAVGDTKLLVDTASRLSGGGNYAVEMVGPTWTAPAISNAELFADIPYSLSPSGPDRRLAIFKPRS